MKNKMHLNNKNEVFTSKWDLHFKSQNEDKLERFIQNKTMDLFIVVG
jgi:hypothetical protein